MFGRSHFHLHVQVARFGLLQTIVAIFAQTVLFCVFPTTPLEKQTLQQFEERSIDGLLVFSIPLPRLKHVGTGFVASARVFPI